MEKFVHQQNLVFLRKQLAEAPNEAQRLQLSRLLVEEEKKDQVPLLTESTCSDCGPMFAFGINSGTTPALGSCEGGGYERRQDEGR